MRPARSLILLVERREQWLEKWIRLERPPSVQGMMQISPEEVELLRKRKDAELQSKDVDTFLWRLIRGADDPDLSKKKRKQILDKLKSITPRRFEYLRTSLSQPLPAPPFDRASDEFKFRLSGGFDLVDAALCEPDDQEDLEAVRKLKQELEQLLAILEGCGDLRLRIKQLLIKTKQGA